MNKSINGLIIVESPSKAKTLKKFLGDNYSILASVGHIRDLPKNDLGVDLENNFKPSVFIVEYNAKFIPPSKFVMDYNESHRYSLDDYFGASLTSYNDLFNSHNYRLICCNSFTGCNAFFVKYFHQTNTFYSLYVHFNEFPCKFNAF